MQRCLLIVPPLNSNNNSLFKVFDSSRPPIGLLSIASYLRQNGVGVELLDFTILSKKKSIIQLLSEYFSQRAIPDWIGISVCTPTIYNAYEIANFCKISYQSTKIVFGGPHATLFGEKLFDECEHIDFIIKGEGEYKLLDLITQNIITPSILCKNKLKSYVFSADKEFSLKDLPMPAYDLINIRKYKAPPSSINGKQPSIGVIATRGCPYNCTFCANLSGRKIRYYPIDKVIEQLTYLKNEQNIKQFHFYDDTLSFNKNYLINLCKTIIKKNLNISWSACARVDNIDENILYYMKKAGCFGIMFGVESFDVNILDNIKKGISPFQIKKALELTNKFKIESRISLIIGTPSETHESIKKTKEEIIKLKIDFIQVLIAIPMPGSEFYNMAKKEHRINSDNWGDYNLTKIIYKHPVFSEKELLLIQKQFYLTFYLRFSYIIRLICKIHNLNVIKNIMLGIKGFIRIIINKK